MTSRAARTSGRGARVAAATRWCATNSSTRRAIACARREPHRLHAIAAMLIYLNHRLQRLFRQRARRVQRAGRAPTAEDCRSRAGARRRGVVQRTAASGVGLVRGGVEIAAPRNVYRPAMRRWPCPPVSRPTRAPFAEVAALQMVIRGGATCAQLDRRRDRSMNDPDGRGRRAIRVPAPRIQQSTAGASDGILISNIEAAAIGLARRRAGLVGLSSTSSGAARVPPAAKRRPASAALHRRGGARRHHRESLASIGSQ